MSDAGESTRAWRFFVTDMIEFGEKVLSYTEGMDRYSFVANARTYDATLRNLAQIGEAATHIPPTVRDAHPEVPWRKIIGARNRIIHGYLGIDDNLIWDIIQADVPALLTTLRHIAKLG